MAGNCKSDFTIYLPSDVEFIFDRLNECGFDAYIVGGCVRDSVRGKKPSDWDFTTNALPFETKECFNGKIFFDTGLKHGTITLHLNSENYEITTYRIDGEYSDHRRPDEVEFTKSLKEDLARRDFTINALAYSKNDGIIDFFGGMNDIVNKVVKCVGEPDKRFNEDAFRIMRALRFASTFGFKIEDKTSESIISNANSLKNIAVERINVELIKLLCGEFCGDILRGFAEVIAVLMPEISDMLGFEQHNSHHIYDVWNHTVKAVESSKKEPIVRLTLLLHDVGKPATFSKDEFDIGHFYGHQKISVQIAGEILSRLRFDNATKSTVLTLIKHHDIPLKIDEISARKLLNRIGEENAKYLIEVKRGDALGQNPLFTKDRLVELDKFEEILNNVITQSQCFSLKHLAINGKDVMDSGVSQGKAIGEILKILTDMVIEEKIKNDKSELINYVIKEFVN